MEAKICPDGSAVSRTGPNCEFAPCPSSQAPQGKPLDYTTNWQLFTDSTFRYQLRYPPGWKYVDCSGTQYSLQCFLSDDYISVGGVPVTDISPDKILAPEKGVLIQIASLEEDDSGESLPMSTPLCTPVELDDYYEAYIECKEIKVGGLPSARVLLKSDVETQGGGAIFNLLVLSLIHI